MAIGAPRKDQGPDRGRIVKLAVGLIEKFSQFGFAGDLCRIWCYGEAPIIMDTSGIAIVGLVSLASRTLRVQKPGRTQRRNEAVALD